MFHPLDGLTQQEQQAANVRVFEGNGTPYLFVPGLLRLEGVRVGPVNVPITHEIEIPEDHTLTRFKRIPVPLLTVQATDSGEQVLLRSQLSNDGMWQKGVKIYVAGEWADAAQDTEASDKMDKAAQAAKG